MSGQPRSRRRRKGGSRAGKVTAGFLELSRYTVALNMNQLWRTKNIDEMVEESQTEGKRLKRTLGAWSLIAFGIGAVIGGGIFTVTGTAAAGQHMAVPSI